MQAECQLALARYTGAIESISACQKSLSRPQHIAKAQDLLFQAHLRRGQDPDNKENVIQVLNDLQKAYNLKPSPELALQIGMLMESSCHFRIVLSFYKRALEHFPEDPALLSRLA